MKVSDLILLNLLVGCGTAVQQNATNLCVVTVCHILFMFADLLDVLFLIVLNIKTRAAADSESKDLTSDRMFSLCWFVRAQEPSIVLTERGKILQPSVTSNATQTDSNQPVSF